MILHEIANQPTARQLAETPITADNNIVFINRDSIIRRPREFKTPPPPKYGEEDEYEVNPRESFYDPLFDTHKKKFDFLDQQRQGSVSNHYKKYIDSKTMQRNKRKKRFTKYKNDSEDESEINDTIGELPGFDVQQARDHRVQKKIGMPPVMQSPPLQRSLSQTSMQRFNDRDIPNRKSAGDSTRLFRNNSLKVISPSIINDKAMRAPVGNKPNMVINNLTSRPIRSGAFQRLNSKKLTQKY